MQQNCKYNYIIMLSYSMYSILTPQIILNLFCPWFCNLKSIIIYLVPLYQLIELRMPYNQ